MFFNRFHLLSCFSIGLSASLAPAQSYHLHPIQTTIPASYQVFPIAINDEGVILVSPQNTPDGSVPYYLVYNGKTTLFNSATLYPQKLNDLLQTVGQGPTNGGEIASINGKTTSISYPGADYTIALGLNNLGQVSGYFTENNAPIGFIWKNGTFTPYSYPNAINTGLYGLNDFGDAVGTYATDSYVQEGAFIRHSNGAIESIGYGGINGSSGPFAPAIPVPTGISDSDVAVGYLENNGEMQGFVYNHGKGEIIDYTPHAPKTIQGATGTLTLQLNTPTTPFFDSVIVEGVNNLNQIVGEWTGTYSNATETQQLTIPFIGDPAPLL